MLAITKVFVELSPVTSQTLILRDTDTSRVLYTLVYDTGEICEAVLLSNIDDDGNEIFRTYCAVKSSSEINYDFELGYWIGAGFTLCIATSVVSELKDTDASTISNSASTISEPIVNKSSIFIANADGSINELKRMEVDEVLYGSEAMAILKRTSSDLGLYIPEDVLNEVLNKMKSEKSEKDTVDVHIIDTIDLQMRDLMENPFEINKEDLLNRVDEILDELKSEKSDES